MPTNIKITLMNTLFEIERNNQSISQWVSLFPASIFFYLYAYINSWSCNWRWWRNLKERVKESTYIVFFAVLVRQFNAKKHVGRAVLAQLILAGLLEAVAAIAQLLRVRHFCTDSYETKSIETNEHYLHSSPCDRGPTDAVRYF